MSVLPAQEAAMLRAAGHEVLVVTPAYGPGGPGREGDVLRAKPVLTIGNAAVLFGFPRVLRGCSVIHLHYPFFGTDVLTARAARALRIPYVVTYHMKPVTTGLKGWIFCAYRLLLERFVLEHACRVLVSSEDYARACRLPRPDLVPMPFGVDTATYVPGDQTAARAALGLPAKGKIAVFVGSMDRPHAFKGVEQLLKAAAQVPEVTIALVGDGAVRGEYEALARRLGLGDRGRFLGRLSDEHKLLAYQAADWHVLPSTNSSEAFGLVTLEAMACGKPSIVSNLPGVRTLVHGEENGLTVIPGDSASLTAALRRFASEPGLVARLGARARDIAVTRYAQHLVDQRLLAELTRAAQTNRY